MERKLDLSDATMRELYDPEGTVGITAARRALRVLEETEAPEVLIETVKARVRRKPPGKRTHDQRGLEARNSDGSANNSNGV